MDQASLSPRHHAPALAHAQRAGPVAHADRRREASSVKRRGTRSSSHRSPILALGLRSLFSLRIPSCVGEKGAQQSGQLVSRRWASSTSSSSIQRIPSCGARGNASSARPFGMGFPAMTVLLISVLVVVAEPRREIKYKVKKQDFLQRYQDENKNRTEENAFEICHKVALHRCGQNFMRAFNLVEYLSGADYYNTQCTLRKPVAFVTGAAALLQVRSVRVSPLFGTASPLAEKGSSTGFQERRAALHNAGLPNYTCPSVPFAD
ncbi:hypothetical protein ISCGN_032446 [Ixodes scapularis]